MSDEKLSEAEHRFLLKVARDAIKAKLDKRRYEDPPPSERSAAGPRIEEHMGCFVTLHKKGRLRGCIGVFQGEGPLWMNVSLMAVEAAFSDPRFQRLRADEFNDIDIEISALSPLRKIKDVNEIKVGVHGIYITKGRYHGVLLPQVATEYGWDRNTFLEHTCQKAGLDENAWKDPSASIEIFSADVFGELEGRGGCH